MYFLSKESTMLKNIKLKTLICALYLSLSFATDSITYVDITMDDIFNLYSYHEKLPIPTVHQTIQEIKEFVKVPVEGSEDSTWQASYLWSFTSDSENEITCQREVLSNRYTGMLIYDSYNFNNEGQLLKAQCIQSDYPNHTDNGFNYDATSDSTVTTKRWRGLRHGARDTIYNYLDTEGRKISGVKRGYSTNPNANRDYSSSYEATYNSNGLLDSTCYVAKYTREQKENGTGTNVSDCLIKIKYQYTSDDSLKQKSYWVKRTAETIAVDTNWYQLGEINYLYREGALSQKKTVTFQNNEEVLLEQVSYSYIEDIKEECILSPWPNNEGCDTIIHKYDSQGRLTEKFWNHYGKTVHTIYTYGGETTIASKVISVNSNIPVSYTQNKLLFNKAMVHGSNSNCTIYTLNGKVVHQEKLRTNTLSVANLLPSFYIYEVTTPSHSYSGKILIR